MGRWDACDHRGRLIYLGGWTPHTVFEAARAYLDDKGSKAREVLVTLEDWEQEHGAPLGHGAIDD